MSDEQQYPEADERNQPPWPPAPGQPDEREALNPYANLPARTWPGGPPPTVEADRAPATQVSAVRPAARRMPRAQVLSLARQWKWRIAIGSVLSFGLLTGLAAAHSASLTTSAGTSGGDGASGANGVTTQPSKHNDDDEHDGGFFGQPGNTGSISPSGTSAPPVTGSHAS